MELITLAEVPKKAFKNEEEPAEGEFKALKCFMRSFVILRQNLRLSLL